MTAPRRAARNDALLVSLLSEVNRCRALVREGRASPGSTTRSDHAAQCAELAEAMRAYADAAAESGVPLPYRYRDEMRLYQAMARRQPGQP